MAINVTHGALMSSLKAKLPALVAALGVVTGLIGIAKLAAPGDDCHREPVVSRAGSLASMPGVALSDIGTSAMVAQAGATDVPSPADRAIVNSLLRGGSSVSPTRK